MLGHQPPGNLKNETRKRLLPTLFHHPTSVLTYFNHQHYCIQKDEEDDEVLEESTCFLLRTQYRVEHFLMYIVEIIKVRIFMVRRRTLYWRRKQEVSRQRTAIDRSDSKGYCQAPIRPTGRGAASDCSAREVCSAVSGRAKSGPRAAALWRSAPVVVDPSTLVSSVGKDLCDKML